jgi:hypothetical protein
MICKVKSLKSQVKTSSFLEDIITSSNEVLKDFESNRVVGISKLGNANQETAKNNVIVMRNTGS